MRTLLLLLPALLLTAQTPAPKKMAAGPVAKNFKLSGSPTAPITIEVYTDFECPACRVLFLTVLPPLEKDYVATGKVQLLHRDFPLPMHKYSKQAAKFVNAAGQIGQYQVASTQIFQTQADWSQNGNVDAMLMKVLTPGDMQKVRQLVASDTHLDDTVNADVAMGQKDGLDQTPTMIIVKNGKRIKISGGVQYEILKSYLDQQLKN